MSFKTFFKDMFSNNNKIECYLDGCNNKKGYLETYYKYKVYYDIIDDVNIHCLEHVISEACYPFILVDFNDGFLKTCQKRDNIKILDNIYPESVYEHHNVIKTLALEVPSVGGKYICFGFIDIEKTGHYVLTEELPITDFISVCKGE